MREIQGRGLGNLGCMTGNPGTGKGRLSWVVFSGLQHTGKESSVGDGLLTAVLLSARK